MNKRLVEFIGTLFLAYIILRTSYYLGIVSLLAIIFLIYYLY